MPFRAFIAVELGDISKITPLVSEIDKADAGYKLVEPEAMHITLKFLGETEERMVPEVQACIEAAVRNIAPFDIGFKGYGAYPNTRRMRILWVGVTGGDALVGIAKYLEDSLEELGFERENREYTPHITLGRLKGDFPKRTGVRAMDVLFDKYKDTDFGGCRVTRILLKKSELTSNGPVYSNILEVLLPEGALPEMKPLEDAPAEDASDDTQENGDDGTQGGDGRPATDNAEDKTLPEDTPPPELPPEPPL